MFTLRNTLLTNSFNGKLVLHLSKRTKKLATEEYAKTKALAHFDDFYKSLFQIKWPSIRLALLSKGKTVAVINNFGEVEDVTNLLQKEGAFDFKKFLESLKSQNYGSELKTQKKNISLEERILKKIHEEKVKDVDSLHPNPENIQLPSDDDDNDERDLDEKKNEEMYDITKAKDSLHQEKSGAEYDKNRLIFPRDENSRAALYDFLPATKLRGLEGYILESEYYKYYSGMQISQVDVVTEEEINFPEHLKVFCFDRGDVSEFPSPTLNNTGTYDYLEMDGADILPVLALDVQPGDYVLHIGYNSGTMGYCLLQTLAPKYLVCSGTKGFNEIFKQYLYNYNQNWNDMLYVTNKNFLTEMKEISSQVFDKILIDVPCTDDKNALFDPGHNLFRTSELRTRLQLPKQQLDILVSALNLVRPGGTVVYTTSTLSPVQNDSVVNEALNRLWKNFEIKFTVKDLSPALNHMSFFYNFDRLLQTKYGNLVVPFLPTNFGPRYFCKLIKNEK